MILLRKYFAEWARMPWPNMYFVRHGHGMHQIAYEKAEKDMADSPREALGVDIPNHEIPLSPLGRWQSVVTEKLWKIEPDCVYSSEMLRAYETAKFVFPGHKIRTDWRLNEKDFGPAHMLSREELIKHFPLHMERYERDGKYFAAKAPGGQNYIDQNITSYLFLLTMRRDWPGKTVVIFCHSARMNSFRHIFEHFSPEGLMQIAEEQWIDNCGILGYVRPMFCNGWRRGKYRIKLDCPPYKLWTDLTEGQERHFWDLAMGELEELRKQYRDK